jgi:hypothetical protein
VRVFLHVTLGSVERAMHVLSTFAPASLKTKNKA